MEIIYQVEVERNDLEQERQRLVIQNAGFKKQLAEIEVLISHKVVFQKSIPTRIR